MQKKKNAYLISAYLDPTALKRLIDSLNDKENVDFYIHVDAKTDISKFLVSLHNYPNITFLKGKERIKVHWGGVFSSTNAIQLNSKNAVFTNKIS